MADIKLRRNLSEIGANNIALRGVVDAEETESVAAEIYWRWEDEPNMDPQRLGATTAGHTLAVPFDLKERGVRLWAVSRTMTGESLGAGFSTADSVLFTPPVVATLAAATFDAGTDEVTLTIANNGGAGTITIHRQIGSDDFAVVATVASSATTYVDSPSIDGTYTYKLTQDGLDGESVSRTVVVDVDSGSAGSPPTLLTADFDDIDTVTLDWTNNGGTGNNIIERKTGTGSWAEIDSVSAATATYDDLVLPHPTQGRIYFYRVRNESSAGYSNEADVYVPRQF